MENSAVNICMITDDNYIMPTSVAIHSMITNKGEEQYNFYIITSNLSEESEKKFKDFEQNGVCVNIIREDAEKRFNGLHNFRADSICVASLSALLKFIIPDLFPQLDRILYLDGDLVVKTDLRELYFTELEENYAAAVVDTSKMYWKSSFNSCVENYFNSGVMLLNLKKMREDHISEVLIETKRNLADSSLMDQNVFNLVFDGKTKLLPIKYNFQSLGLERAGNKWDAEDINKFYGTDFNTKTEVFQDTAILHYASKNKPWKEPDAALAYEWTHYYRSLYGSGQPPRKEKYGISVIMPCYNAEQYLKETIDSVLRQTFKDFEIILIDDGSTDSTADRIREYADKYENISAYFGENRGTAYEKNYGVTKAQGKYIHFLNCGDLLDPGCYEKLYTCAEDGDLDCILFEGKAFYESKELEERAPQYKTGYARREVFPNIYTGEQLFILLQSSVGMITHPGMQFARRDYLIENDVAFPQLKIMEENLYTYKLITRAGRITVLPDAFYQKRVREHAEMTAEKNMKTVQALAYTVLEVIKEYEANKDRYDFATAIFKHIVALCKTLRKYETKESGGCSPKEQSGIRDTISLCCFIAAAGERSAMCKYTTAEYRNINFKLNKAYRDKSEINAKLQQTYKEKSELNAKLQKTYKEKSEKTKQIKRLEKWSVYPLLRKVKRLFKKK